ncbi:Uncharacterised protein (plasmid) [Legionella adelaidensis]|uniref:Uncharacterized protein n=1 Tax=Legionella adelaidensis TaxID=45056 RepID=A0A0W0R1V9_9GAMM|nr:hypothetical protein [Legionella adelaidensis]KTC64953.1 hypothetical protein Lade_1760 [Legionella adelaidensis]VEH85636.1 Uncharacterised protein [Legionella adelaidensis]
MKRITQTLEFFCELLKGENKRTLASYLKAAYGNKLAEIYSDFHTKKINEDAEIAAAVQEVLKLINIDQIKKERFQNANITLYEFLSELQQITKRQNAQVNEFIRIINSKDKRLENIAAVTSIGAIGILTLSPVLLNNLPMIEALLGSAIFFPVVGLVYTIATGLYTLYQSVFDFKTPVMQRFTDNFFLSASTALNVAAYSVLISAAVSVNPVAAILFVAASSVDVLKESFNLIKLKLTSPERKINPDDSLADKQEKARADFEYKKARNNLFIALGGAGAMVGIIAVWSFIPGGIFLSVAAVAAIGAVYLAKTLLNKYSENRLKEELEQTFEKYEQEEAAKGTKPTLDTSLEMAPMREGHSLIDGLLLDAKSTAAAGSTPALRAQVKSPAHTQVSASKVGMFSHSEGSAAKAVIDLTPSNDNTGHNEPIPDQLPVSVKKQ